MRRLFAAAAAGVRAGIRPSAGSVTMDVRSVLTTRVPASKNSLLYVPTPPVEVLFGAAARSHSPASAGVKNGLSLSFTGRCSGVAVAEFQMPPKSGCPPDVEAGACARAGRTNDNADKQTTILSRLIAKPLTRSLLRSALDTRYHARVDGRPSKPLKRKCRIYPARVVPKSAVAGIASACDSPCRCSA